MKTVGPDKRGQYYLLSATEVIADLKSHPMGLTNTEAARRLDAHGANALTSAVAPANLTRAFKSISPLHGLILVAALCLAIYLENGLFTASIGIVILLQIALTWQLAREGRIRATDLGSLLPDKTRVVRNGQADIIPAYKLVVGDIVQLQPRDIVPADLRLIEAKDLSTNDALLFGGSTHTHKFTHFLPNAAPVAARNNLVFAGTSVTAGEATGIVVAAGMQTELGRIAALNQAVPAQTTKTEAFANWHRRLTLWMTYSGAAFCLLVGLLIGATSRDVVLYVYTVLTTGAAILLPVTQTVLDWRTRSVLNVGGVRAARLRLAEQLAETDVLIFDPESFGNTDSTVCSVMVGRTAYTITGDGYAPTGKLLQANGKPLTKQDMRELSLVFEAGALAHQATVLPPDGQHPQWYVRGDPLDGALLTAARRAGMNTEKLRDAYTTVQSFPYDIHRQLRATVRRVGEDNVLFVSGDPTAVMARSSKLWDHGHVRNFTDGDQRHIDTHHTRQIASGQSCIALAYRVLPKRTSITNLTMDKAEQKLTFLGVFDIEHQSHEHTASLLQAMRGSHIQTSLLTNRSQRYALTSDGLRRMTDKQLVERLMRGTATFSQLSSDDKLRLVRAAQAAGHHVAMSATSLSDLPALRAADSVITTTAHPWLDSNETVQVQTAEAIAAAPQVSHAMTTGLRLALQAGTVIQLAIFALLFISTTAALLLHIPLEQYMPRLLALLFLLLPLALSNLGWGAAVGDIKQAQQWLALPNRRYVTVVMGLSAATITFGSYLAYFIRSGISPQYLDPASIFQTHAATISFVTLVVLQWVTVLFVHRERFTQLRWHSYWNASLVGGLLLSGLITMAIVYQPDAERLLNLFGISTQDWLWVIVGGTIYAGMLLFEQKTRHHTRHATIRLHHDTYGKASPARI